MHRWLTRRSNNADVGCFNSQGEYYNTGQLVVASDVVVTYHKMNAINSIEEALLAHTAFLKHVTLWTASSIGSI
jgi:hypothetical protein